MTDSNVLSKCKHAGRDHTMSLTNCKQGTQVEAGYKWYTERFWERTTAGTGRYLASYGVDKSETGAHSTSAVIISDDTLATASSE